MGISTSQIISEPLFTCRPDAFRLLHLSQSPDSYIHLPICYLSSALQYPTSPFTLIPCQCSHSSSVCFCFPVMNLNLSLKSSHFSLACSWPSHLLCSSRIYFLWTAILFPDHHLLFIWPACLECISMHLSHPVFACLPKSTSHIRICLGFWLHKDFVFCICHSAWFSSSVLCITVNGRWERQAITFILCIARVSV